MTRVLIRGLTLLRWTWSCSRLAGRRRVKDRDRHTYGSLRRSITNSCWKLVSGCSITRSSSSLLRTRCARCSVYMYAIYFPLPPFSFSSDPGQTAGRVQNFHHRQSPRFSGQTCESTQALTYKTNNGFISTVTGLGTRPETREDRQVALGRASSRSSDRRGPPQVPPASRGDPRSRR
jgi:hypothetical protein